MLEASLILLTLILMSAIFHKINIPVIILSLVLGLIFGSDVTGLIYFDNAAFAKQLANTALMFLLFIGGFGTRKQSFREAMRPVMLLATVGIVVTALITGAVFHFVTGFGFLISLLVGSITASTDAAAVFSILKTKPIKPRVRSMIELESVANDPMAVVLTMFMIGILTGSSSGVGMVLGRFIWQLGAGVVVGIVVGWLAVRLFHKLRQMEKEFFYVYLIAIMMLSYSLGEIVQASGMLATFFCGFVMGNSQIPFKKGLMAFNNTVSFIINIGLFILLGLLAFPHEFAQIWDLGIIAFLIITFISRPITVLLLTPFSGFSIKEKLFMMAVGIRGSVPVVLATYPAAAGLDPQHVLFNIVFFTVSLSMIIQGSSIMKLAEYFKLVVKGHRKGDQVLELVTVQDTNYEIIDVYIDEEFYEGSCVVSDLTLPPGTLITFINRGGKMLAPSGKVEILPRDTLTILVEKQYIDLIPIEIMKGFIKKSLHISSEPEEQQPLDKS